MSDEQIFSWCVRDALSSTIYNRYIHMECDVYYFTLQFLNFYCCSKQILFDYNVKLGVIHCADTCFVAVGSAVSQSRLLHEIMQSHGETRQHWYRHFNSVSQTMTIPCRDIYQKAMGQLGRSIWLQQFQPMSPNANLNCKLSMAKGFAYNITQLFYFVMKYSN